ncbi:MAG: transposase [Methanobrevibacter woesei]|nr:transposase [Methanobrevibacter woesei]
MNNYTMDCYETKREILNFSKKMANRLNKTVTKFIIDMQYGLSRGKSCLISEIARSLEEKIDLKNTIERLCDNLVGMKEQEIKQIEKNYQNEIKEYFGNEPIAIFDDSDIAKRYGKKFEDLDDIIDASSEKKEVVKGYHVCEATILGEKEKQPFSVYSKIYSCKSEGFVSMNRYTMESIQTVINVLNRKCNMIFDRGYDDNKIIEYVDQSNNYFVIRMNDKRNFLFKGRKKNAYQEAIKRKGKIRMTIWFEEEKYEVSVSHTKVTLPYNKKDYELVIVYGLSEERPLILLTNRSIHSKEDVIKVVRLYFYRWRVEEYFRSKKQEYDFENMRVRSLKAMNCLNLMLMIHMGHLSMLIEDMDKKLLTIKIINRSKSLKNKVLVWFYQIARGIKEILSYAKKGIKELEKIEKREKYKQITFRL